MDSIEKFKEILERRLKVASSIKTKSVYTILLEYFNKLVVDEKLYTEKEVKQLCYNAIKDHAKLAISHQPYNEHDMEKMKKEWWNKNKLR